MIHLFACALDIVKSIFKPSYSSVRFPYLFTKLIILGILTFSTFNPPRVVNLIIYTSTYYLDLHNNYTVTKYKHFGPHFHYPNLYSPKDPYRWISSSDLGFLQLLILHTMLLQFDLVCQLQVFPSRLDQGLPLCHLVHKWHKVKGVLTGMITNLYLGIGILVVHLFSYMSPLPSCIGYHLGGNYKLCDNSILGGFEATYIFYSP